MIRITFFFTIIFFTLFGGEAVSQEFNTKSGYIVTHSGDTIHGLIRDKKDIYQEVYFSNNSGSGFQVYKPENLKAFGYEGGFSYFTAKLPDNKEVFLLTIITGKLSLFQYFQTFFVSEAEGELVELKHEPDRVEDRKLIVDKRFIRMLVYLTSDCPHLKNKAEKLRYVAPDIAEFIEVYNECVDPGRQLTNKQAINTKWRIGGRLGALNGKMVFPDPESTYYGEPISVSTGVAGGIYFSGSIKEKLIFQLEALYNHKTARLDTKPSVGTNNYEFNFRYIDFPLSIYYHVPTKKIQPFVSVGGIYGVGVNNETIRYYNGNPLQIDTGNDEMGVKGSIGLLKNLNGKKFGLEYSFEKMMGNNFFRTNYYRWTSHLITVRFDTGLN